MYSNHQLLEPGDTDTATPNSCRRHVILLCMHRRNSGPLRTVMPQDAEVREQTSERELPSEEFWRLVIPGRACPGLGLWTSQISAIGSPTSFLLLKRYVPSLLPSTLWNPQPDYEPQWSAQSTPSLESKVLCEASPFLQTHVEMTFQGGRNRLSVRKLSTVALMEDTVHILSLFL